MPSQWDAASGGLLGPAIPQVRLLKSGRYMPNGPGIDVDGEVEILSRIERNTMEEPLSGFVSEGNVPAGNLVQVMDGCPASGDLQRHAGSAGAARQRRGDRPAHPRRPVNRRRQPHGDKGADSADGVVNEARQPPACSRPQQPDPGADRPGQGEGGGIPGDLRHTLDRDLSSSPFPAGEGEPRAVLRQQPTASTAARVPGMVRLSSQLNKFHARQKRLTER
jgi:hypothetical protein